MAIGDQSTRNESVSVNATSSQISPLQGGKLRRIQIAITNTSAFTVYLTKGTQAASSGVGVPLASTGTFIEADDAGFRSWQGQYQAYCAGAGTLAIMETFQEQ